MSAHTPGPWAYKPAGCFLDADGKPTTTPIEFQVDPIMAVLRVGNVSAEKRKADARLIAAAPEMLEALKLAREDLSRYAPPNAPSIKAIRDAIKKATE